MTSDELNRYKQWLVDRDAKIIVENGGRNETVMQCAVCGFTWFGWRDVAVVVDPKVTRMEATPHDCSRCTEILQRAPEIYNWTLAVVARQHAKLLDEILLIHSDKKST